jgi:hypothetical protein
MSFKTCSKCCISKLIDEYYKKGKICKECFKKNKNESIKKSKEKHKSLDENKICVVCNQEKHISMYDFRRVQCKECVKITRNKYLERTKDKRAEYAKKYRLEHPEHVAKSLEKTKEYNKLHRKEITEKEKIRRYNDPDFKLKKMLRDNVYSALKRNKNQKNDFTMNLLGCDIIFFRKWIESQFTSEMSWNNHATFWQLDHIKPIYSFDLKIPEQQKECFNWKNHQPLFKTENMNKSSKIFNNLIENKKLEAIEFEKNFKTLVET